MQYGIRIITAEWACQNGGDDDAEELLENHYTGTQEEMLGLLETWKREQGAGNVRYAVVPYTGQEGKPPALVLPMAENPRNSRMKRIK